MMRSINILSWNYRGISSRETYIRLRQLLRKHNPTIFCLVETRADSARLNRFRSKLSQVWDWAAILDEGMSGGIIVLWKRNIGQVIQMVVSWPCILSSLLILTLIILFLSSIILIDFAIRFFLWQELNRIAALNLPWLILCDFNCILSQEENSGGLNSIDAEIQNTETTISSLEYIDSHVSDVFAELSDLYSKLSNLQR